MIDHNFFGKYQLGKSKDPYALVVTDASRRLAYFSSPIEGGMVGFNPTTQTLQWLEIGSGLTLSPTGVLTSAGASDDWGLQVALTNSTLIGDGTSSSPLGIAPQGATTGDVLTFNGTTWTPQPNPADSWGSQVAATNTTITGDGTPSSPLGIAQQGAAINQVLSWSGTTWTPVTLANSWILGGNPLTSPQLLGTTTATPLLLGANSTTAVTITDTQLVGVNTIPTERLDVNGNIQFSGALMPNATPGNAGDVLRSQGANTHPIWQAPTSLLKYYSESSLIPTSPTTGDYSVSIGNAVNTTATNSFIAGTTTSTSSIAEDVLFLSSNTSFIDVVSITGTSASSFIESCNSSRFHVQSASLSSVELSTIIGYGINITSVTDSTIIGLGNNVRLANNISIIGNRNDLSYTLYDTITILGSDNRIDSDNNNITLVGDKLSANNQNYKSGAFGYSVNIDGVTQGYGFGANLYVTQSNTIQLGVVDSTKTVIDAIGRITFQGPLSPAGSDGMQGDILTSQGPTLPPIWVANSSTHKYRYVGSLSSGDNTITHNLNLVDPAVMLEVRDQSSGQEIQVRLISEASNSILINTTLAYPDVRITIIG